jgi:hypothetical protein
VTASNKKPPPGVGQQAEDKFTLFSAPESKKKVPEHRFGPESSQKVLQIGQIDRKSDAVGQVRLF